MSIQLSKYELLATALEPRFGNIYQYNMAEGMVAGYDFQDWTDELRDAIKHYLLHDLPADIWDWLLGTDDVPSDDIVGREAHIDTLIERLQPGEIASTVRNAAVCNVSTLDQLISGRDEWRDEDDRWDAMIWLDAHEPTRRRPHDSTWAELAEVSHHYMLLPPNGDSDDVLPEDLVDALTPPELLRAWQIVVGPAPSDLTDQEWQLLKSHFGPSEDRWGERPRPTGELATKRRIFNAIRYKMAHHVPWSRLPSRYGTSRAIYQRYNVYKADGLFTRLHEALRGNPEAGRVAEWLGQVIGSDLASRTAVDHLADKQSDTGQPETTQ